MEEPTGTFWPEMSVMKNAESKLTPKQETAVLALLAEPTIAEAARSACVSQRSLHRWLSDPQFEGVYRLARRRAFGQAVAQLQQTATLAVQTLRTLLTQDNTPAHVRVSAARNVLTFAREGIEFEDFDARLTALENRSDDSKATI